MRRTGGDIKAAQISPDLVIPRYRLRRIGGRRSRRKPAPPTLPTMQA